MATLPLLLTACASFVAAACFAGVAISLRRRRYSPELRRAGQAYVLWWVMFALQATTDGLRVLLGMQDPVNVRAYVFLAQLKIVAAGVGIWALARYVIFLRNGRRWASLPIAAFAAAHAAYFLAGLQAGLPAHIAVDTWSPRLVLEGPGLGATLGPSTLLFYFLPPIVLAIAYLALVRRMETRTQRFRVASIGIAILVFQAVSVIQFDPKTAANSPMFAILPLVSAAMGLVVLATYVPPGWLARWLRIEGLPKSQPEKEGKPAPAEAPR